MQTPVALCSRPSKDGTVSEMKRTSQPLQQAGAVFSESNLISVDHDSR